MNKNLEKTPEYKTLLQYFPSAELDELGPIVEQMHSDADDFIAEISGMEFRFINGDRIERIYHREMKEFIEDNELGKVPSYVKINWDATINYIQQSDGYGHWFASYDGEEGLDDFGDNEYYLFRIN
jgi:hypothetical protein